MSCVKVFLYYFSRVFIFVNVIILYYFILFFAIWSRIMGNPECLIYVILFGVPFIMCNLMSKPFIDIRYIYFIDGFLLISMLILIC